MAIRTATAEWKGDLQSGTGSFSGASGQLGGAYSFESRFTDERRHQPGGAHRRGPGGLLLDAARRDAGGRHHARVRQDRGQGADPQGGRGLRDHEDRPDDVGRVPGIDEAAFQETARQAKDACLISKALGAVETIMVETLA